MTLQSKLVKYREFVLLGKKLFQKAFLGFHYKGKLFVSE